MRDSIKDKEYFEKYISYNKEYIDIITGGTNNLDYQQISYDECLLLYVNYFDYFIAEYSIGESLSTLYEKYIYLLDVAKLCFNNEDSYVDCCWLVSLGVMFNIKGEALETLKTIVKQYERNDKLINFMMNYLDSSWEVSGDYFMKDPYELLEEVITSDKENAVKLLKNYLEKKWYKAHNEMSWYNSHKSKNDTYCGYWAFETGALVKILGLNDEGLKDVPYYPYDLAHYEE